MGWQHTGTNAAQYTWTFGSSSRAWASTSTLTTPGYQQWLVCNLGATNSQFEQMMLGSMGTTISQQASANSDAIDTTTNQDIAFKFSVNAADSVTPKSWTVEILRR